jgi:hypothetical protein
LHLEIFRSLIATKILRKVVVLEVFLRIHKAAINITVFDSLAPARASHLRPLTEDRQSITRNNKYYPKANTSEIRCKSNKPTTMRISMTISFTVQKYRSIHSSTICKETKYKIYFPNIQTLRTCCSVKKLKNDLLTLVVYTQSFCFECDLSLRLNLINHNF